MTRSWNRCLSSVVLVAACWSGLAAAAQAETFTVTRSDDPAGAGTCATDRPSCSLRQAVTASAAGDTIQLGGTTGSPAVYGLTQGNALLVDHSLTITGAGRAASKIDGTSNRDSQGRPDRILKVTGGQTALQLSGVTFTSGTDGRDENFASCSPCDTITANGGGALFNQGATVNLNGVGFEGNAGPVGGAVGNAGTLIMADVEFRSNSATFGAGLFSRSGTVTATRVSFRDSGGTSGGGFYLRGGTMTLTNSTVTGNGASNAIGGGIVNQAGALTLTNVTLDANLRGGLETDQGASTSVQNTILGEGYTDGNNGACVKAGRTTSAGAVTAQAVTTDLGNNLVGDTTCAGLAGSPVDPLLAPAGDNGGSTSTAALLHGSPAIDAGNDNACPESDQRAVLRAQQGAHCDIGAFEAVKLGAPTVTTGTASGIGAYSATLSATVDLAGEAGALHFRWGTSPTALTETSDMTAAGVLAAPTQRFVLLQGLNPGTTYYFQAVADNATGAASSPAVQQFTTGPAPPVVSEVRVTAVTDSTATIEFSVNPSGAATHYVISYDTDDTGASETVPVDVGSGADPVPVKYVLTHLSPDTEYTFDVIATNAGGSQDSGLQPFTTNQRLTAQAGSAVTLSDTGNGPACPTASIDWGDGTPADVSGKVTCSDDGQDGFDYQLVASHAYASAGRFHITIAYGTGRSSEAWAEIRDADVPLPPPAATPTATPAPVVPTPTATPRPTPTFHETVVVKPVSGTVLVKLKGSTTFVPLTAGQSVPLGSQIDTTKGKITLTSVPKAGGRPETAFFYAGIFTVTQRGEYTELKLSGPLPTCKKGKASAAAKKVKSRMLWGDGKGKFRTRGQYSAATIRGTRWLVEDSCAGTLTQVKVGVVAVDDRVLHKTKIVRAGRKYLARPRK